MHQTRRELLDEFVLFVSEKDDAEARTIAEGCLGRALLKIWLTQPWRAFRSPTPLQLTLTVDQRSYALPDYFGRIGPGEVRNATRGYPLSRLSDGDLESFYPQSGTSLEQAGAPAKYEIAGTCGVATQPAVTGDALEAVSSDASDTDVVVALAGGDIDGNWTRAQATLNGTNAVAVGTWTFLDEFGKSFEVGSDPVTVGTSSRGTVTLRKAGGGTTLQQLRPQESAQTHDIFTVYPKPNAADLLLLPVIRKPKRLFNDGDALPDLWTPALFEEMFIDWQVNVGEVSIAESLEMTRPRLLDLVAFENQQGGTQRKQAFGMGRR